MADGRSGSAPKMEHGDDDDAPRIGPPPSLDAEKRPDSPPSFGMPEPPQPRRGLPKAPAVKKPRPDAPVELQPTIPAIPSSMVEHHTPPGGVEEPGAVIEPQPVSLSGDTHRVSVEMSDELADSMEAESDTEIRRRGGLPRPKMLDESGKLPPAEDFRQARPPPIPQSSAASSIPKGVVPPRDASRGVPDSSERRDTDLLIASVAEDLIALVPDLEDKPKPAAAAPAPGLAEPQRGFTQVVTADDLDDLDFRPNRPWLPWAFVAAAAVLLLGLLVWPGDDEPAQDAAVAVAAPEAAPGRAASAPEPDAAPAPTPEPDAAPAPEPEAVPEEPEEEVIIEDDVEEPVPPPTPTAAPTPSPTAHTKPTPKASARKSKRRSKRGSRRGRSSRGSSGNKSSAELLREAKKALNSGRASTAYKLASQSNQKKRSTAATRVMAFAACKMRAKERAKAAFRRLPTSARGGIRNACRKRGIRLGI